MGSFIKKTYPIMHWWWVHWSNFRWRKVERYNQEIDDQLFGHDLKINKTWLQISILAGNMYKHFYYTKDGIDQLRDSVCPPPFNYERLKGDKLYDDCDGFHVLMYHLLHANDIESYLMSVITWKSGHCISLIKFNDKWYYLDYTTLSKGYENVDDCINAYNAIYLKRKNAKAVANGFIKYDYEKGKFKTVKQKELK